jgi:hypothetical protein
MATLNSEETLDKDGCRLFDMLPAFRVGNTRGQMRIFVNLHYPEGVAPVTPPPGVQTLAAPGLTTGYGREHGGRYAALGGRGGETLRDGPHAFEIVFRHGLRRPHSRRKVIRPGGMDRSPEGFHGEQRFFPTVAGRVLALDIDIAGCGITFPAPALDLVPVGSARCVLGPRHFLDDG